MAPPPESDAENDVESSPREHGGGLRARARAFDSDEDIIAVEAVCFRCIQLLTAVALPGSAAPVAAHEENVVEAPKTGPAAMRRGESSSTRNPAMAARRP
jgi:hypothetical protein